MPNIGSPIASRKVEGECTAPLDVAVVVIVTVPVTVVEPSSVAFEGVTLHVLPVAGSVQVTERVPVVPPGFTLKLLVALCPGATDGVEEVRAILYAGVGVGVAVGVGVGVGVTGIGFTT